ncbi:YidB family protein [Piscinibacter sp. XHJ-5]|uniref:YidB family protein n=1 Tax=Piscinibacter sp. XHJ-5 TaxID=3037797 RepID=UPI00245319BB|nr:YidB family protein [Piscinibacter sp. XHJ-5]
MGLLDSVIGVLSGIRTSGGRGDMLGAVLGMLADDGTGPGISTLIDRFAQGGQAETMNSWIAGGENLPISPDVLQEVLGADTIERLAQQLGLSRDVTADRLSQMLPYVIDKLTPAGEVPVDGLGDMGKLMGRMASR